MSYYVNNDKAIVRLPNSNVAVKIIEKQEEHTYRLEVGGGVVCEITFINYGEMRAFFLQATAEILGLPDPHCLPDASLSKKRLVAAFANSILEKYNISL